MQHKEALLTAPPSYRVHNDAVYIVNADGSETFLRAVTKLPPAAAQGSERVPQFGRGRRLLRDWAVARKPSLDYYDTF